MNHRFGRQIWSFPNIPYAISMCMYYGLKVAWSPWACFPHVIPIWLFCLPSHPKCIQPTTMFGRCTLSHKYLHVTLPLTYSSHLVLTNTIHCIFVPNAFSRAAPWNQIIKFRKNYLPDAECCENQVCLQTCRFSILAKPLTVCGSFDKKHTRTQKQQNISDLPVLSRTLWCYFTNDCVFCAKSTS